MTRPDRSTVVGQGDVDGLLDEHASVTLLLELDLPALERLPYGAARRADPLAGLGLRLRRERPDLTVGSASGLRSPACASRASLSASRSDAAATAASASVTAASTFSWLSAATSTGSNDLFGADMRSLSLRMRRV